VVRGVIDLGQADGEFALHPVAVSLLDMVAQDYDVASQDGRRSFVLVARRP
jgi:hypothetical protein